MDTIPTAPTPSADERLAELERRLGPAAAPPPAPRLAAAAQYFLNLGMPPSYAAARGRTELAEAMAALQASGRLQRVRHLHLVPGGEQ